MTALIWKEFREHLKWAVLGLLGMTVALVYALAPQRSTHGMGWEPGLCASSVQITTTVVAALGGFLLGLVQSLPDGRRDRRGFLLHRPLSRTRLFFGKVLGGLALYIPATLLPLLGAAAWLATPGQFAFPCPWRTLFPGLADVAAGVVFYLDGMLAGWRPARWHGSRLLGVGAALLCAVFVHAVPEFGYALLVAAAGATVLGLAAWGSFLTGGEYAPQPRAARVALAVTLAAGLGVAALVASVAFYELLRPVTETWERYQIDGEGRILRLTYRFSTLVRVTDAAGQDIEEYRELLESQAPRQLWRRFLPEVIVAQDSSYRHLMWSYRAGARYMTILSAAETNWVYVSAEQRIDGYAVSTRRLLGTLGPDGFRPPHQAGERFAGPPTLRWGPLERVLTFRDGVYLPDFPGRTITRLYSPPAGEQMLGADELVTQADGRSARIVAATDRRVCLLDRSGTLLWTMPHAVDAGHFGAIVACMSTERTRYYLGYSPSGALPRRLAETAPHVFAAVADDGTVLSRTEAPPLTARDPSRLLDACAAFGIPPGLVAGTVLAGVVFWRTDEYAAFGWPEIRYELTTDPSAYWITGAVCLVLGLLSAVGLTVWLTRRYAFSIRERRWWTILAALLGPGVVLLLLALRDWPSREPCPTCHRKRVVTRETCEHCGAGFPPPRRGEADIHEPVERVMAGAPA